jgi:hypothetical protein
MRDKRKNVMRRLSEFEETVSITLMPSLLYTDHAALIRAGSSQNIYNIITHDDFFRKTKRSLSDPEAGPLTYNMARYIRVQFLFQSTVLSNLIKNIIRLSFIFGRSPNWAGVSIF